MPPPAPEVSLERLSALAAKWNESPALRMHGLRIAFPSTDLVVVELPRVLPEQRGGLGTSAVNGAVLAAIFDLAIGTTAALVDPDRRSATVQLSISFERPAFGDSLRAEARIDTRGNRTLFSSARILDATGVACARCQGVVAISRPGAAAISPLE